MKLIDRYLASRLTLWLLIVLLSVLSLYVLIDLATRTRPGIVEHGASAKVVFSYYLNYLPVIVLQITPIAFLISCLFVLGNFARNNEYTAMLAGGVSLYRVAVAPVAVGAAVALFTLLLGEFVLPPTAARAEYIEQTYLKRRAVATEMPLIWSRTDLGETYVVRAYNPVERSGKDVMITKRSGGTVVERIEADRVFYAADRDEWMLENVTVVREGDESEIREQFEFMPAPAFEIVDELAAVTRSADESSFRDLRRELTRLKESGRVLPEKWVDLHSKLALPAANFIILFLAMPFAFRVKRGGMAVSFGISVGIGVVYMGLFEIGQALGRAQYVTPWVAAWVPNIIFFIAGLHLTSRTET
jgi:lipopolysaccharide export system permease protein